MVWWAISSLLTKTYDVITLKYHNLSNSNTSQNAYFVMFGFKWHICSYTQNFQPIHRKICILLTFIYLRFTIFWNCDVITLSEAAPRFPFRIYKGPKLSHYHACRCPGTQRREVTCSLYWKTVWRPNVDYNVIHVLFLHISMINDLVLHCVDHMASFQNDQRNVAEF